MVSNGEGLCTRMYFVCMDASCMCLIPTVHKLPKVDPLYALGELNQVHGTCLCFWRLDVHMASDGCRELKYGHEGSLEHYKAGRDTAMLQCRLSRATLRAVSHSIDRSWSLRRRNCLVFAYKVATESPQGMMAVGKQLGLAGRVFRGGGGESVARNEGKKKTTILDELFLTAYQVVPLTSEYLDLSVTRLR